MTFNNLIQADFDNRLFQGQYCALAGVQQPMLKSVKDITISGQTQIQTLTFDADLVADDSVNGKINGVSITEVVYATSHNATMTALALAIQTAGTNVTAVVSSARVITVTTALGEYDEDLSDFVVTNGGLGTATATEDETQVSIEPSAGLKSGMGINMNSLGVATLSSDNETHIIVGSNIELVDGTNAIVGISGLNATISCVEKGLARISCIKKHGEIIVPGDNVAFENGKIVKRVSQTNYYVAEDVQNDVVQIEFK